MIQVKNNKIINYFLPDGLKDKSGEDLRKDGWLPIIEDRSTYDKEKEILIKTTYEILEDKVILHYGKIPRPSYKQDELTEIQLILYETQYQTLLLEVGGM